MRLSALTLKPRVLEIAASIAAYDVAGCMAELVWDAAGIPLLVADGDFAGVTIVSAGYPPLGHPFLWHFNEAHSPADLIHMR